VTLKKIIIIGLALLIKSGFGQINDSTWKRYISPWQLTHNQVDPKANGLGKVFIAADLGPNAIFNNPAGLSTVKVPFFSFGADMAYGYIYDEKAQNTFSDFNAEYKTIYQLSHLSIAYPLQLSVKPVNICLGAGFHKAVNLEHEVEAGFRIEGIGKSYAGFIARTSEAGLNLLSGGVSIDYKSQVSFGLGLHQSILGTQKIEAEIDSGGPQGLQLIKYRLETSGSARFLSLGAKVKIRKFLTLGFSYFPEYDWVWDPEHFDFYLLGIEIPNIQGTRTEITMPGALGLGAACIIGRACLFGDFQTRYLEDLRINGRSAGLDNSYSSRLGIEVVFEPFLLRGGFFLEPVPLADVDDSEPILLQGYTGGLGVYLGRLRIDSSFEYKVFTATLYDDGDRTEEQLYRITLGSTIEL
jgi:hypothetical protein